MKLGLGLYRGMLDANHFRFARQAGATHVVAHAVGSFTGSNERIVTAPSGEHFGVCDPGDPLWTRPGLARLKSEIEAEGLVLEALENFCPAHWSDILLDGPQRDMQVEHIRTILRDMGHVGIPIMGLYFSLAGVWGRVEGPFARAGAVSVGFEAPEDTPIPAGMVWNMVVDGDRFEAGGLLPPVSVEEVESRFLRFLDDVLPAAEEAGVRLAIHPDDPPLRTLRGTGRLICHPDDYHALFAKRPHPNLSAELCLGTVGEMPGADIYDLTDRLAASGRIGYIHFRNVRGKVPHYHEVFVDEGETDMVRILRILHARRYDGVLIPDHTPVMECSAGWHAGIAYALGYMKAAIRLIEES
ncbi:MAG: mannonate dehydratase [Armatimonadota bacterium]